MRRFAAALLLVLAAGGCQSDARATRHSNAMDGSDALIIPGLTAPARFEAVDAMVVVPPGWRQEPLKSSDRHKHQVWLSPSGSTAYGVIRMKLPLPVGPETVLRMGVMPEMKRTEGEAVLLSSYRDNTLPGVRFVAEGGRYLLRSNLMTRGWRGWVVYAGTLRDQPVNDAELALAELARENTRVGESK